MISSKRQKIISVMLAAAMVTSMGAIGLTANNVATISASAASLTTADGFSYEVISGTNTVRITGYSKNGKITIPSKIDGKAVVEIGNYAFNGKTGLQSVTIPSSVKTVGECAFRNCTGLRAVTISNGVETIGYGAFYGCTALKEITIPDSVTAIYGYYWDDNGAFQNCTALKKVKIGKSVTEIGKDAFRGCTALDTLTIGKSVETIGKSAFEGCESLTKVTLPNSLTEMGTYVFYNCINLKDVNIGAGITTIPENAFEKCTSLNNIVIPSTLKVIEGNSFRDCTSLQAVTISNGVETIGYGAFYGCTALKEITIPDSVTAIYDGYWDDNGAFQNCTALKKVKIGKSVTEIGKNAFRGCTALDTLTIGKSVETIGKSAFEGCESLTKVTLPNSLTKMGTYVFYDCANLKDVNIGVGITTIPDHVFAKCTSLKNVNIGAGVTTISDDAFEDCTALEEITIPDSVTIIGYRTFSNCTSLKKIVIPESVTVIDGQAFNNHNDGLVIYGYSNDCEAKKFADANNITYKLIISDPLANNSTISATNIELGKSVTLKASATGGTAPYKYYYYYKASNDTKWIKLNASTSAKSRVTTPTGIKTYNYKINIVDAKGTLKSKTFTVKVTKAVNSLVNNSTISATNIELGDSVTLKASATGGTAPYKYYYYYKASNDTKWIKLNASTSAKSRVTTPTGIKTYNYKIGILDANGNCKTKIFTVKVNKGLVNNSTISATNVELGSPITLKASATGGVAPYKYYYYYKASNDTKWIKLNASTSAKSRVTTPTGVKTYNYKINVVGANGTLKSKIFTVKVNKATNSLVNNSTISATNIELGDSVTLKASATGGKAPYKYYYYYKASTDTKWIKLNASTSAKSRVTTPTGIKTYNYKIGILDANGNCKTKIFTVNVK